jgi:hypothetical protein
MTWVYVGTAAASVLSAIMSSSAQSSAAGKQAAGAALGGAQGGLGTPPPADTSVAPTTAPQMKALPSYSFNQPTTMPQYGESQTERQRRLQAMGLY